MSNRLKVEHEEAIKQLLKSGKSQRAISRELGVHRRTVKRIADEQDGSKCTIPLTGSVGRKSHCEGYDQQIESKLELGLSAERIHRELSEETDFSGSYDSVQRYVKKLKEVQPRRVWRMECEPGQEAQVDYLEMYLVEGPTGRLRKVYVLRVTLSCTRKGYTEAGFSPNTESFLRAIENAFRHFGGVPLRLCTDNLKAAVIQADWYDPELNPKLASFARHYGCSIVPARPYTPTDKGKVENAVKYVRNNALKGKRFKSLAELNTYLRDWEAKVADLRIHGTTKKQVLEHFKQVEQPCLQALPESLFESFEEGRRSVHRDSYIEVKGAYYEVPPQYVRAKVWTRWNARQVRVYDQRMKQIAVHPRLEKGGFSKTLGVAGVSHSVRDSVAYYRRRIETLGDNCLAWADARISEGEDTALRRLQGLCGLANKHPHARLDEACRQALLNGQVRLKQIRMQLANENEQLELMETHPVIRPMEFYENQLPTRQLFEPKQT